MRNFRRLLVIAFLAVAFVQCNATVQEEEPFEFISVKAIYPDIPEECLLAWDIYDECFQITAHEPHGYHVFKQQVGEERVNTILKEIRQGATQQNPVLQQESFEIINRIKGLLPATPEWLREKLASEKTVVATFGYRDSLFAIVAKAVGQTEESKQESIISAADVQRVVETYLGYTDEMFDAADLSRQTLIHALHAAAIMDHFGIHTIHYRSTEKEFPTDSSFANWPDTIASLYFLHGGGLTVSPVTGASPTTGFAVAVLDHSHIVPAEQFFDVSFGEAKGRQIIREYLQANARSFLQPGIYLGIWHDLESDLVFLDLSEVFQDRDTAIAVAKERDQIAIYDLSTGKTIPTGGSGGIIPDHVKAGFGYLSIFFIIKPEKRYHFSMNHQLQEAA